MLSHNRIRWGSCILLEEYILKHYEKLYEFVGKKLVEGKETTRAFHGLLAEIDTYAELATRVEIGKPIVRSIYSLGMIKFTFKPYLTHNPRRRSGNDFYLL
jgi:hypothetical protein